MTLVDDGAVSDQVEDDGIYSGQWTPSSHGTFTLTFPDGDTVTVTVTEVNSITPNPVDLATPPASFTITRGWFAELGLWSACSQLHAQWHLSMLRPVLPR